MGKETDSKLILKEIMLSGGLTKKELLRLGKEEMTLILSVTLTPALINKIIVFLYKAESSHEL